MASSFFSEFNKGLTETFKYVLSHHEPAEYYKCFHWRITGNDLYVCSRCLGVYIGIISCLAFGVSKFLSPLLSIIILAIFPSLALLDWALSTFTGSKGHNLIRFTSGLLLGVAYCLGILMILSNIMALYVILVGLCYICMAFVLLCFKFSCKHNGFNRLY